MSKIDINEYELVSVADGAENSLGAVSETELEQVLADTVAYLNATKFNLKKTPVNLCLAAGILGARGGEFSKVTPIKAVYKHGVATKSEVRLLNKSFITARIYYFINKFVDFTDKDLKMDGVCPYLARKKQA